MTDPVLQMWREYRIVRITGWTLEQIEAAPGEWLDWALRFDDLRGGAERG